METSTAPISGANRTKPNETRTISGIFRNTRGDICGDKDDDFLPHQGPPGPGGKPPGRPGLYGR